MKSFYKITTVLFLFTFLLTACNKENIDEVITEDPEYTPEIVELNNLLNKIDSSSDLGAELDCITIRYPFEFKLESGAKAQINTQIDLESALNENAMDPAVDFIFPLEIIIPEGDLVEINDNPTLGTYFASCIPDKGWDTALRSGTSVPAFLMDALCYELIYPVNLEDEQGNTYVANDETQLIDLLASNDNIFYVFPMTVLDGEGNEVLLENIDAFFDLIYDCESIYPPIVGEGIEIQGLGCFNLVFPFDVALENGDIVTVNNENEYAALILNGQSIELQFPFSVISMLDQDQEIIIISDIEDFIAALLACGIIIEITETDACDVDAHILLFFNGLNIFTTNNYVYNIHFPVTLIVDGIEVVLNNGDEYLPAIGGLSNIRPTEIVYPVTVTQFGREIVLNNDDDVCDLYNTLDEPCENKPAHIQFFFNGGSGSPINCAYYIDYPLEIVRNGTTIQIQSRDDYLAELNTPGAYDEIELVYPVSAFKYSNNQRITFGSAEDICYFLDNCF